MRARLGKIHDVREELARDSAAIASLTVLTAGRRVDAHVHTNPYLALHVLGSYRDRDERGDVSINGPAALFFPAGSAHEMIIGRAGLATVIVEFDADVLNRAVAGAAAQRHSRPWVGGEIGSHATRLAQSWLSGASAKAQLSQTFAFLQTALTVETRCDAPPWLDELEAVVDAEFQAPDVERWAREVGVARPWLLRAYRHWRGEGLGEMLRRRRVENAAILLETTDLDLAEIAAEAGFCDQSHMNRAFKRHTGRTPARARAARWGLAH